MKFTIDSSAVRGDYMKDIVTRTMHDIHDTIATVFGPNATDAYIHRNGQLYYTRDGKEVLASMNYDNVISSDVLHMLFQAVERQATLVGDGTTTLAILYTNLYNVLREREADFRSYNINQIRKAYGELVADVNDKLKQRSIEMTDDLFHDLVYTCTQDAELTEMMYDKLKDAVKDQAYMVIDKSNMDDEMEVESHDEPFLKAEKIYSTFTIPQDGSKIDNCIVYYVDGALDIASSDTFVNLAEMTTEDEVGKPRPNIVIVCNGTTQVTRNTISEFQELVAKFSDAKNKLNNIIIVRIQNPTDYTEDMKEDLIAYLYNAVGVGGAVNQITFEANLYQAFNFTDSKGGIPEKYYSFDAASECLDLIRGAYFDRMAVSFVPGKGMRLYKPMPFVAKERYEELVARIEVEKSAADKARLNKRLRTVYGKFIQVKIGSTLMKDSQRKYELILDAVKSSMDAYRNGALAGCSIVHAVAAMEDLSNYKSHCYTDCAHALKKALYYTFANLVGQTANADNADKIFNEWIKDLNAKAFNLNPGQVNDHISGDIVEPLSIMTMILKNSTMCFELAFAKLFSVDTSVRNYIE